MNRYKSLLLFSATVLLLVRGRAYADEVSQSADQVPAVVMQADSQANQPPVINQGEQQLTASEETSQVQDSTENQEPAPDSPDRATDESQSQQAPAAEASTAVVTESESQDSSDISAEEYEANVADLKQVTMADVYHMFDDQDGNYTLYIGRPTCHYCRDFSPVIKEFNGLTGGQVHYLNTDNSDFTPASKEFLRRKIGEYATPTILHLEKGQILSGQVGSGGTAQELYAKVFSAEPADEAQTPAVQDAVSPQTAPEPVNAESSPTTAPEQAVAENKEEQVTDKASFDNVKLLGQVLKQAKAWLISFLEKLGT